MIGFLVRAIHQSGLCTPTPMDSCAGPALTRDTSRLGGIAMKFRPWFDYATCRAHGIRIRIATCPNNPCASMQQVVIRVILTDHKIGVAIVSAVAVDMMDFGSRRQRAPERLFSNPHMFLSVPDAAAVPRLDWLHPPVLPEMAMYKSNRLALHMTPHAGRPLRDGRRLPTPTLAQFHVHASSPQSANGTNTGGSFMSRCMAFR
jgi:hypothetical protein